MQAETLTELRHFGTALLNMRHQPRILLTLTFLALGALLILPACAPVTPRAEVEDRAPLDPQSAYERGDYQEAARQWEQQAVNSADSSASQLRLKAMDAWLLAGEFESARNLKSWIDISDLSPEDLAVLRLIEAELALTDNNPVGARRSLGLIEGSVPEPYASRFDQASEQTQNMLGNLGAENLQQASELAQGMQGYDVDGALALLRSLENVSSLQLGDLAVTGGDPERTAWFDLALTIRENLVNAEYLESSIYAWKDRHPEFEIGPDQALDLWMRYRQDFSHPQQVAMLLPESGGLARAGAAIRDGIMNAYLSNPGGSEINFFDSGGNAETVLAAYFDAADAGADWIVGPLSRSSIEGLLGLAGLVTPVLALNELPADNPIPPGLEQQVFGMSLSQEKEAAAIARRMSSLGFRKTLILAPQSEWGDRISTAFEENFLQEEGELLVAGRYLQDENDHSQVLEDILQIAHSKERKTRLENRLGIELEFEPLRRSDIDSIFLAANPEQARQLAPQLRFFDAGNIPTFSTSRIFTGQPDPSRNRDLNGVNLPITNWQLEHSSRQSIPGIQSLREGRFAPLFAIGMDAWNVLPWLELMSLDPDFTFPGQSGVWSINGEGELVREPYWGEFNAGRPIASRM